MGYKKGPDVVIVERLINNQYLKIATYKAALDKNIDIYKPGKALKIDNDCGPVTIEAIKLFQQLVLKWQNRDGRVDPGGTTWKGLNGNVGGAKQIVKKSAPNVSNMSGKYAKNQKLQ